MAVLKHRIRQCRVRLRGAVDRLTATRSGKCPFTPGPAAIITRAQQGNLFAVGSPHIGHPELVRPGIETELPWITEANDVHLGPDRPIGQRLFVKTGSPNEGVVGGHREVGLSAEVARNAGVRVGFEVAGFLVHINPNDAGIEVLVDELGVMIVLILSALIPEGDIQIAVGAEPAGVNVVIGGFVHLVDEDDFR